MKHTLEIAPGLHLPLEAITNTFGIFGIRGSGKSNVGAVMAEGIIRAGEPVCIIDPTGAWYGLKSSADGKSPGLPVYVFGGEHADVPLEPTAGEVMANFIVENRVPIVLDLKLMRKHQQIQFVTAFAETLYHRNREPLMLLVDEVARFAPQIIKDRNPDAARCLGALEDIAGLGRVRGLGMTIIGQRPAPVSTTLRTQCETLVCLRTIGKHDRKAIDEWVEAKGTQEERNKMMADVADLPNGTGYFWSPSFLNKFLRVNFHRRATFDSGATPKIGQKLITPKAFASIDKSKLSAQIQATIEKQKADDPKELKRQIAELQKKAATPAAAPSSALSAERLQKEFERGARSVKGELGGKLRAYQKAMQARETTAHVALKDAMQAITRGLVAIEGMPAPAFPVVDEVIAQVEHTIERDTQHRGMGLHVPDRPWDNAAPVRKLNFPLPPAASEPRTVETPDGEFTLTRLHRTILTVLAQHREGMTKSLILVHADYRSSGDTSAAFSLFGRYGFVETVGAGLRITRAGLDALGEYTPLPTGSALREWLLNSTKLVKVEKAVLKVICDAGGPVAKGEILRRAGYKSSGDTSAAFSRLVRFGYAKPVAGGLEMAKELDD